MSKEFILEIGDALYNEETGEAVFKPILKTELIRCKDCIHRVTEEAYYAKDPSKKWQYHNCSIHQSGIGLKDDDFCSEGERRGENDEG